MATNRTDRTRLPTWLALLLVSLAGLLLEVAYTRIVSFKLLYYFTYLVIGLSLLGIGSGGIAVSIWPPIRRASTERVVAVCSLAGAVTIPLGYWAIASLPVNTLAIWDYGTGSSFANLGRLALLSFCLFASFVALGVIVATVLGRGGDRVGRLYFSDLVGAGLGCLLAIPLIIRLDPPGVVMVSALVFAVVGLLTVPPRAIYRAGAAVITVALAVAVVVHDDLPDVRTEASKLPTDRRGFLFTDWGPVFRVDVAKLPGPDDTRFLIHDGLHGSGIWRFDGNPDSLTRFDTDARSIPFGVLGGPPGRELIVGSAGGQEILASLYFDAPDIEAVELNPVTVSLLTDHFADYTGHLTERPDVHLHQGDARTYMSRSDRSYDLVWFVAPDSYAANNAASSGAFVLSESYLYTTEMIEETLDHLTDDGIMAIQFGELDFEGRANRTSRYVVTAREALHRFGVDDPSQHIMVSAQLTDDTGDLSTILVKRTAFTPEEVEAFAAGVANGDRQVPIYAPGGDPALAGLGDHIVNRLAGGSDAEVDALVAGHDREIDAVTDDEPFFWHFSGFGDVLSDFTKSLDVRDTENDMVGERVLLLLLGLAIVYAAVLLLLPFVAVRRTWAALPAKGMSGVYFAALGLGFMFFEITMIQRLVLFLGYPTYSLTVTLASILVFTGIGALLSRRLAALPTWTPLPAVLVVLAGLTLFYRFGLDPLTDALLSASLGVRVLVAVLLLAPLGLCLGMFMPFGLRLVSGLSDHGEEYSAWGWAVNGFFSVIGSVLTTILSMTFGFRAVQMSALAIYAVAVLAFLRLRRTADRPVGAPDDGRPVGDGDGDGVYADGEAAVPVSRAPTVA
jgi:hypothetical protein